MTRKTRAGRRAGRPLEDLREDAVAILSRTLLPISDLEGRNLQQVVQELQVHQMELVMQNEQLLDTQMKLESARNRYAALYDSTPVGCATLDSEGTIEEINRTAAQLLGAERGHLLKRKFHRYIAPISQDIFYLQRQTILAEGTAEACQLQLLRSDGSAFHAELRGVAVQDDQDKCHKCLIAFTDVTERLQAEAERSVLADIVKSSSDAIIGVTLEGNITSWNTGAEQIFNYSADEVVGRPLSLLIPAEERAGFRKIQQRIELGEQVGYFGGERITKDGRRIIVSVALSAIKDMNGQVTGISSVMRDITRQQAAEEDLRESERHLADFFNSSPLGLLWVDERGNVLRVNQAQLNLLGYEYGEVAGHPVAEFHADPEIVAELLKQLRRKHTVHNQRARLRSKDGSIKHVLIDAVGRWEKDRLLHYHWFVRDVTRRRELEREILAIAERERHRIGQDLHDDLGQQLAGIEFLTQTLAGQLRGISRKQAAQARKIAAMVRETMNHARELAHGLSPIGVEKDGLMVALQELAARTQRIFRINCRFSCRKRILMPDHETAIHLYHIAQEAVSNAIKHGKATRINIGLTLTGDRIVLAVKDNGIGLPKANRRSKGLGLRVIQYRAGVIGGSLVLQRGVTGGTTVVCSIQDPGWKLRKGK